MTSFPNSPADNASGPAGDAARGPGEFTLDRYAEFKPARRSGGAGGAGGAGGGGNPAARGPQGRLFDRLPPHSLESEMALLGAMLLDPRVIGEVLPVVHSEGDFYSESHGKVFRALVDLYDKHQSVDLVQLNERLRDLQILDAIGGADYLVELANAVPAASNAPYYARIVADKARLRRLIDAAGKTLWEVYNSGDLGPEATREILDRAEQAVFEIAKEDERSDPQKLSDLLQREIDRIEASEGKGITGLPTGYRDLDELLMGLQAGELIIVAARPSMGKTALALNLAEQIAMGGVSASRGGAVNPTPVAFFSMEMSKAAVTQRLLSARAQVSGQHLRSGRKLEDVEFKRLIRACGELSSAPIYIDDTPNMSVMMLRSRARQMVRQHGVRCIMIDYLQLMSSPTQARESRQVEVSAISRGIKALARELDVPVVCLAQLNRASEQREGNRPRMADLRESGSIEQDADVVILLHREEYYHIQTPDWALENPDKVGVAELIIAKQRNGPTDVVKLKWESSTTRFSNYTGQTYDQGVPSYSPGSGGGGGFGGSGGHGGGNGEPPPFAFGPGPGGNGGGGNGAGPESGPTRSGPTGLPQSFDEDL